MARPGLSEAEIMAALNDPDPGNRSRRFPCRLIEGYTENFRAHVERLGSIPQTAIEAVAMRLTTEAIQQAATGDV